MKKRTPSPELVKSWIARGDGQGCGKNFRPFFRVRDVPSRGRSSMVLGLRTGRIHHYLSDLEYACHLLAEYRPDVCDIREQFALLPWEETQQIAEALGIRHPIYPGTRTPLIMTSDLVLTTDDETGKSRYEVICVKPSSEIALENPRVHRTLEKLLIEKTYWDLRGIPWSLVTEQEIPMNRVRNLDLLRISMLSEELDWLNSHMKDFLTTFNAAWTTHRTLLRILDLIGKGIGLCREECFTLLGRAVWLRLLPVDLDKEVIHHDRPLHRSADQGENRC